MMPTTLVKPHRHSLLQRYRATMSGVARSVGSGMSLRTRLVQSSARPSSTIRLFLAVSALAFVSSGAAYSQEPPLNNPPVAQPLAVAVPQNRTLIAQLPGVDLDGDPLVYAQGAGPSHGTLIVDPEGRFTYSSNDFKGIDSFTYTVSDGGPSSAPGIVTIRVGNDSRGFVADSLHPQLTAVDFPESAGGLIFSQVAIPSMTRDQAVDRASRRLYVLTTNTLRVYDIDPDASPATPVYRGDEDFTVSGKVLALSLDGRTAFIGSTGKVTAVNLYPESVFQIGATGAGESAEKGRYENVREFPLPGPYASREIAAMAVHPAGNRLLVVIDMLASEKKLNINNDLLRSDVGNGTRSLTDSDLPSDFGYLTQLDISADVQTSGAVRAPPQFAPVIDIKALIYPDARIVAIGIKGLAFTPDGNCALLSAVGAQTVRATPFGVLPTTDEGTGGIVVLSTKPQSTNELRLEYLGFIPTTERGEKTAELRQEIRKEGARIMHPEVQWARAQYLVALGARLVSGTNRYTALPTTLGLSVATEVLGRLEESFKDYGSMQAYFNLYPRDMVGASSVAIGHLGDFGIVTLQDTNNLGLLALAPSTTLAGYTVADRPDFFIATGTGKTINGFDGALAGPGAVSNYSWAYPQEVVFTSDDSRIFIGMAGGTAKANPVNKFGSADALVLRTERDRVDSVFKSGNPPPGYVMHAGPELKSPRQVAALQSFDADRDRISDQLEAYNRWNTEKTATAYAAALISTDAARITDPGKPAAMDSGIPDCLDYGYLVPPSGVGYRLNTFGMPIDTTNFATKAVVTTLEHMGVEWNKRYQEHLRPGTPATPVTRPYFIVGLLSQSGGGVIKNASEEALKYMPGTGSEIDFPYFSLGSDAAHDFVTSNGPVTPLDNSVTKTEGFDRVNTEALIRLLLAQPRVSRIELDPAVLELIPGLSSDSRIRTRGSLQGLDSRRDLDNRMFVTFACLDVDMDIDSDNNGVLDGTHAEDLIEEESGAGGKFVPANLGDLDGDQIPDYADDQFSGPNTAAGRPEFTPIIIRFPVGLDLANMQFRLTYSASDPAAVTQSPTNTGQFDLPTAGSFRIWAKDGDELRLRSPLDAGGDFIASGVKYPVADLAQRAATADSNHAYLVYIESVKPALNASERDVIIEVFPQAGPQSSVSALIDMVLVSSFVGELAVDANRDGEISFFGDGNSDATSAAEPYRFWSNDDIDREHIFRDSAGDTMDDIFEKEEDDIGPAEAGHMNWQPDYIDGRIESKRDLEDFARLWINTQGLDDAFRNGDMRLGLKWTDTGGTSPSIQIYRSVEQDGGLGYLTNETIAADQLLQARNAIGIVKMATGEDPTLIGNDTFVLPTSLFAGLSEAQTKNFLLFEGCTPGKGKLKLVILKLGAGATYTEIGEGPGVWMEIKKIGDMYEHWSVGNTSGGPPESIAARIPSLNGSSPAFSYDSPNPSPEEQKYILFVHGWNMEQWEKERFAETAYKRLWWQGYKGRFGLFTWPCTNRFDETLPPLKLWEGITDGTNFDRGEWSAWRSGAPLRELLETLNGNYNGQLYVFSHSMGGIAMSEALRLQSDSGSGQIVNVYVASQAALSAHLYDGTLSTEIDSSGSVQWTYDHPKFELLGINPGPRNYGPDTPNVYRNWLAYLLNGSASSSKVVGTLVNFFNENDWALAAPIWQFNQITKPDWPDPGLHEWIYSYAGDLRVFDDAFRKTGWGGVTDLRRGNREDPLDRYEIMAFAAESYVKAFGVTPNVSQGVSFSVNLRERNSFRELIWPTDGGDHKAHIWHSGQFRSTIQRQRTYWKTLLGPDGFRISTTPLP